MDLNWSQLQKSCDENDNDETGVYIFENWVDFADFNRISISISWLNNQIFSKNSKVVIENLTLVFRGCDLQVNFKHENVQSVSINKLIKRDIKLKLAML